jgi:hypothetical protein
MHLREEGSAFLLVNQSVEIARRAIQCAARASTPSPFTRPYFAEPPTEPSLRLTR